MAQVDDLRAALVTISDKVTEVSSEVGVVATEVAALNEKLKALPASPDLTEVLEMAQSASTRLTDAAAALKAIPTPDDIVPSA